ncbi:hypothetical protein [Tropicimonas sp. IMCC34011]|uniref:phage baseplate plug family protein n=1 Tax=Tropicimonas sp. IMCC34011 TaxID=2248759 RepID=UPI000E26E043|nr:hypothetical protein [Tropicimonas sp. IMCC34011]
MKRITVSDHPDQQFSMIIAGRRITMRLRHNPTIDRWSFDLAIDDGWVLRGRRIVTGVDLLKPFGFGIGMIFAARTGPLSEPDRTALPAGDVELYQA